MKITCKFCDWTHECPPYSLFARDFAMCEAGRHYERHHAGMMEVMHGFDQRLEEYALLPDTREEVER
jgi:hypothetical protein